MPLQPGDAHGLDIEQAFEWLERHAIAFEHLEKLEEMQALIEQHLTTEPSSERETDETVTDGMSKSQVMMEQILVKDQTMKIELSDVYLDLMTFMNTVGSDLRLVMAQIHGDFDEKLARYQRELVNNECPIVVAGETSAGKSSLLNLLLGTDVLPHSLLCATSTICRLHNSPTKRFEIITKEGEIIPIEAKGDGPEAENELKEKLKPYVSSPETHTEHMYKQVEIYWPIPMLQDRVTIVDTPGVGETEEMTERLLEYLPNAVAFIYVINSANSGGIQEERLLHILNKQRIWEIEGRLTAFDYTSTIFVCNKWDIVEKRNEEDTVWKDTETKLHNALPGFPLEQVFKMSVTEADRYNKSELGRTAKFNTLLDGIERLVPSSLLAKMSRHFKFLEKFLVQVQSKILSRINHAKKSEADKNKLYEDVVRRLNKLNMDSDRVQDGLLNTARSECQMMVNKLHDFLHTDEVKQRLLSWRVDDAPDIEANDFEVTKFKGDTIITTRIMTMIKEWEEENNLVKEASKRLTEMFKRECQIISKDCIDLNVVIEGLSNEDLPSAFGIVSPGKVNDALFTKSEKVILVVAAPLWIPLVTAASLLFFPVGIGMFIKETIKASKQRKDFMENKVKYMKEWTQKIMDTSFTEENICSFIFDIYLGNFKRKIEELCVEVIPKQIAADQKMVNIIVNDMRTSHQILSQYQPLLYKVKLIMGKLRLYELKYLSTDLIDSSALHMTKEIGKGNFSDVYLAVWTKGDIKKNVALKVLRRKLKGADMISQLEELEILRQFHHPSIVEIYGVCYDGQNDDNSRLTMVLEYCEKSLEDLVFHDENLQCSKFRTVPERREAFKFYVGMSSGVCDGLTQMHKQGYLHRDLKLSNVLVKNKTAKLCDLGFARMEIAMTGTFVGTMTHMSPELLKNENYTFSSDIYSLAILLWELWYGHYAYAESEYRCFSILQLLDAIKTGQRPKLSRKYGPTKELKQVIEACWSGDPSTRPTAPVVGRHLREMFQNYHPEMTI